MKAIKVKVNVNIRLSDETMDFVSALMTGNATERPEKVKEVKEQVKKEEDIKPAETAKAESKKPVETKEVETKKVETKVTETVKAPEAIKPENVSKEGAHTIEQLRELLGTKVNDHRSAIKEKLTSFGAKNLTALEVANYGAFHKFLTELQNG